MATAQSHYDRSIGRSDAMLTVMTSCCGTIEINKHHLIRRRRISSIISIPTDLICSMADKMSNSHRLRRLSVTKNTALTMIKLNVICEKSSSEIEHSEICLTTRRCYAATEDDLVHVAMLPFLLNSRKPVMRCKHCIAVLEVVRCLLLQLEQHTTTTCHPCDNSKSDD